MTSSVLVTDQYGNEDKRRSRRTEFKIDIKHGDYFILKEDDEMYSSLKGVKWNLKSIMQSLKIYWKKLELQKTQIS